VKTTQREDEWLKKYASDDFNREFNDYFDRQFREPYRSTVAFCNWLEATGVLRVDSEQKILDIGTGKGANVYYMGKRYPYSQFVGIDINKGFIREGDAFLRNAGLTNCRLRYGDLYDLPEEIVINRFDGIISYQTLSWLPDFRVPLINFMKLKPKWIAVTSLFYEGNVNARIEIEQYEELGPEPMRRTFYNVYSLPLVRRLFEQNGFTRFYYTPFEIDIDLAQQESHLMRTHTEKLENGKRIQISGPVLMSWYFLLALRPEE
jgi:SAM-dependent methyltransferase